MNKKNFFEIYNDVVNYKADLYSLDEATLIKIETMLKEEIKIRDKIIEDLDNKIKKLNQS